MAVGPVTYATDLYDRSSIERLIGWFGRVIEAVVGDASVVVGDVSLLDRGERDLLLSGWSGAGVGAPVGVAPALLAAAVAADADAVAVVDGARAVSYRELDAWSTRLARVLIEAGVGPERAVGVAMDRCVELVVAWWAVVKAGGVYVPVDTAHPVERIATVLDAAGVVCVLTCGANEVAGAGARPVLRIDELDVSARSAQAITDADRLAPLTVANTAYVIYTSGSTGVPKGVAVSHAGLLGWPAADVIGGGVGGDLGGGTAAGVCRRGADRFAGEPAGQRGIFDPDGAVDAGSGPAGRVGHADGRRGGLPGGVGGRLGAKSADVQRVWAQRGHHLGHLCAAVRGAADRHRHPHRRGVRVGA
jgi:hypothetical protein